MALPEIKHKVQKPPYVASVLGYGQGGFMISVAATISASDKLMIQTEFYRLLHRQVVKETIELAVQATQAADKK